MGHASETFDIGYVARRIANALAKNRAGVFIDEFFNGAGVVALRKASFNSLLRQNVREESVGGAVELGKRYDVVAHFGDVDERVVDRGHAGADAKGFDAAFERGDALFEDGVGRIADARVDVALDIEIEESRTVRGVVELEGHGLIDGYGHGFGRGIAIVAGVNRDGFELHGFALVGRTVHDGFSAGSPSGCGMPRELFDQTLGKTPRGEAGAEGEAHDRTEAVGRGKSGEIKAGNGGLESSRQHRRAFDAFDFRADIGAEARQSLHIDPVSGSGDDVVGHDLAPRAVRRAQVEMHFAVLDLGAFHGISKQERHAPDHLILHKPASGRTKRGSNEIEAEALRQVVKRRGCIGEEDGRQARTKP